MDIILASSSPRRAQLLSLAHVDFTVLTANIDESWLSYESPKQYIVRMIQQKCDAATTQLTRLTPYLLISADTIGVLDGEVLTKPTDFADAQRMWRAMSGRCHQVWTAVAVRLMMDGQIHWQKQHLSITDVYFRTLNDDEMVYYWATGEPWDKAGAYAIQGYAASWVVRIDGDYSAVVGLPLAVTVLMIKQARKQLALIGNPT